jgi:hypothetical protein
MTVEQEIEANLAKIIDDLYKVRSVLRHQAREKQKTDASTQQGVAPEPEPFH